MLHKLPDCFECQPVSEEGSYISQSQGCCCSHCKSANCSADRHGLSVHPSSCQGRVSFLLLRAIVECLDWQRLNNTRFVCTLARCASRSLCAASYAFLDLAIAL